VKINKKGDAGLQHDNNLTEKIQRQWTLQVINTGYFTSDNEPDGITNATHNTFSKKTDF
jgi:hypothetical protein